MTQRALTPKQQLYVDARVSGLGPSDAYRKAYKAKGTPQSCSSNAAKLESKIAIQEAIAEGLVVAKEHRTLTALITRERLLAELEEARQLALMTPKGASAAVAASMGKARLQGLDKQIIENKTTATVEVTTPEARAALVAKLKGRAKK